MRFFRPLHVTLALLMMFELGIGYARENGAFHYRLQVRIEPTTHELQAEAWIHDPPSSRFYLYKGLSVHQVTADGKAISFHLDSTAAPLPYSPAAVATATEAQDVRLLHIQYGGEISEVVSGVNLIQPDLVELALYTAWFPMFEKMKSFSFDLETDLPRGFSCVTNGAQNARREQNGRSISAWSSYSSGVDIVLLASPLLHRLEGGEEGTRIEIYYSRLPEPILRKKIEGLSAGMRRLANLYGPPRVRGILQLVYSPRSGWGYSRLPLIVVSEERARGPLSEDNGEAMDFRDNCHEMAHFWWAVADPATPDDWINEGLAEFSAFRLTKERYGGPFAELRLAEYRRNASQNKTSTPIAETETSSPDREVNRYDKATLMFVEAQQRFGAEPLDKLLKAVYTRFGENHQATTALFLEEAERQMGKEAAAYFREKLYRKPAVGSAGKATD
jgi:hypothetical protein